MTISLVELPIRWLLNYEADDAELSTRWLNQAELPNGWLLTLCTVWSAELSTEWLNPAELPTGWLLVYKPDDLA